MTRSERMQPVRKFSGATEKREAGQLAATEDRLAECERKLAELRLYEQEYRKGFNSRVSVGMGGGGVRDYQQFLARLSEAIRQQMQLVAVARAERDAQQGQWREAATRNKAIDHVVENWKTEERRHVERHEQRESDQRAQRKTPERTDKAAS